MALKTIVVIALVGLVCASAAQAENIIPTASAKDIEARLASVLRQKLNVKSELKVIDDKGDDLQVVTVFRAEEEPKLPNIAVFIDTRILTRDKKGVQSQAIRIFATADLQVNKKDRLKLLEWANAWNDNALPMRVQIVRDSVLVVLNIVTTRANPQSEDYVVESFLQVAKIWPAVLDSLRKSDLMK